MKRIINNLTPQKQQYEIIKNKILTLKNWTRAFHRSSLLRLFMMQSITQ